MAADLHIHALVGVTEDNLAEFNSSTLGSKYFNPQPYGVDSIDLYTKFAETPQVWIGEVSWLKAALFEDDRYVPSVVEQVSELIGEDLPVLDEVLANKIREIVKVEVNDTTYSVVRAEDDNLEKFLKDNIGQRLFTISW